MLEKIIGEKEVANQADLLNELFSLGIRITQATLSRDLQEMGVYKVRVDRGRYRYEMASQEPLDILWKKLKVLFENFVSELRGTSNLLVIKTSPGNANGVASIIDQLKMKEILGTIAGDDTILVVFDTLENRKTGEKRLSSLIRSLSR